MAVLVIEYRVTDFAGWKVVFDQDPLRRHEHGAIGHAIYADPHDRDHVLLLIDFQSADDARSFRDLPALQRVWEISGAGASWVLDEVETATYPETSGGRPS